MALSALRRSLESQVPPRPPAADKAVCTSPLFTGSATSKRLATSPLASHATPKRHAVTPALKQHDENNNEVRDQDGFVLVDRRRHRQRKQTAATPGAVHARQQPKPRPVQRGARHRPDVIVIKAKDASKYADILRSLKSDPTLQQKVGSSVNNIRRSAAGALMLQLKKGVENASNLGEELGKVLGTAATVSALLHTSTIEIKDLDECATKEEVTAALDALLGVPVSKRDLAEARPRADRLGELPQSVLARRLRAATAAGALVTWPLAARVPTARSSATDAAKRATKQRTAKANHRAFSAENEELTTIITRPQARAALWPGRSPRPADDENPPAQLQTLRGCPGPALRHHQRAAHRPTTRPSSSRSRTTGLRAGPRRAGATGGNARTLSMWTVSLPSCPAHRSLPGPRRIWRRASCPSSPAHVMPRCPRQNPRRRREPVYWWTAEIADLRRSCQRARRLFQRSRGRHDEENPQRELRLSKASSARGDQDQQASVLEAALRRGRQRRLGQTIQGCHVAPRMPAGQAAQLSSPGARRGGGSVSAGAERACPATATSSGGAYTGRHLGGTQRSSVEDKGALRARPG
ncbi:unnamed protein product [Trichogramma brassicae]|uniref:Uncharacterized protein n=1 Tax=Trichogramma brassicae TaxID=86971 RepID=A0A6H5HYK2_9HYME|nr:unnamed protein product [Trichogramma brassicae]